MIAKKVGILIFMLMAVLLLVAGYAYYQPIQPITVSGPVPITDNLPVSRDPACCLHGGQMYLAYEVDEVNGSSIFVGRVVNDRVIEIQTASAHAGDNTNPFLTSWNGKLTLFWDTSDEISTEGKDRDIAMRIFDGNKWGNVTDVSSWGKSEDSEDNWPQAIPFAGELHVIWENDTSILHRAISPSGNMGPVLEIGTGMGADIDVSGDTMYAAWTTDYDPDTKDRSVHVRAFSGVWSDDVVSVNPNTGNLDYFPSLEGFENKLYIAWVTKDKTISSGEGDDDIVIRYYDPAGGELTDPGAWSAVTELSDPEEDWDDWPVLHSRSGELVAVWQTWNHATNIGDDGDDLVMRVLEGGSWGEPIKVTDTPGQAGDIYERGFSFILNGDAVHIFYQSKAAKLSGNDWQIWMAII